MNRVLRIFLPAILLVCLSRPGESAQSYPAPPPPQNRGPFGRHPISSDDDQQAGSPKPSSAALERERYLELRKETTELARLASELQAAVAQSSEHTLSLELARKADKVEKLSKRIRDRIKRGD